TSSNGRWRRRDERRRRAGRPAGPAARRRRRRARRPHARRRRRGSGVRGPARGARLGRDRAARSDRTMPYLYAVIERNGVLAGVVGDPPGSLWDHEAVVEAVMQDGAVLPMRFGSVVDDVEAFLASRRASLVAALSRVRGAVELGVRPAADDRDAPSSGTE